MHTYKFLLYKDGSIYSYRKNVGLKVDEMFSEELPTGVLEASTPKRGLIMAGFNYLIFVQKLTSTLAKHLI